MNRLGQVRGAAPYLKNKLPHANRLQPLHPLPQMQRAAEHLQPLLAVRVPTDGPQAGAHYAATTVRTIPSEALHRRLANKELLL